MKSGMHFEVKEARSFDAIPDGKEWQDGMTILPGGRFRHGTSIIRWRHDKKPSRCTVAQVKEKVARKLLNSVAAAIRV